MPGQFQYAGEVADLGFHRLGTVVASPVHPLVPPSFRSLIFVEFFSLAQVCFPR